MEKDSIKKIVELVMVHSAKNGFQFSEGSYDYLLEMGQNLIENALNNPDEFLEDKNVQAVVNRGAARHKQLVDNVFEAMSCDETTNNVHDIIGSDEYDSEAEVDANTDKELLKKHDQKLFNVCGSSYENVCKAYRPTKRVLEVNHMPPKASYKGTKYSNIPDKDKPAIAMHRRHHRNLPSTHSKECIAILKTCMQKSFVHAFIAEMAILWIHHLIPEYISSLRSLIDNCRSGKFPGAPSRKGLPKEALITEEEHSNLIKILLEMNINKFDISDCMKFLDNWIPKDASGRVELLKFLQIEPKSHAAKRERHNRKIQLPDVKPRQKLKLTKRRKGRKQLKRTKTKQLRNSGKLN